MTIASRSAAWLKIGLAGAVVLLAPPALAQGVTWDSIPLMQLEGVFRGPLRDTVVQRWRDPGTGNACYLFIPMNQAHSPPNESGYVSYGPNTIGTISCVPPTGRPPAAQGKEAATEAPTRSGGRPAPKPAAPARARSAPPEKPPQALSAPPASAPLPEPAAPAAE